MKRYALVGTGHRAQMYIDAIIGPHADVAELVAWADTNPGRIDYYERLLEAAGVAVPQRYRPEQLEEMVAAERVDVVIVTTPDGTHADLVAWALEAGADVVVEKPLTVDLAGCQRIMAATRATRKSVIVTFNYRYSPRNSSLRKVIADGSIGRVTSVHFEWVLDTVHGADYFRRWHRDKVNSGGLLVHKASHHFDLVNWWIADVPSRVFASGGLRFYGSKNALERGLGARPDRGTGDVAGQQDPFLLDLRDDERLKALYLDAEHHDGYRRDQDVFADGITIEDNMAVIVDYAGGPTLTYSLNAHSPWEGYRVSVNGTAGRAELEVVERAAVLTADDGSVVLDPSAVPVSDDAADVRRESETLIVQRHWERAVQVDIPDTGGAHGGGDEILLADLFRGPGADPLGRPAGYVDGLASVVVGIAANRSLESGLPVLISELDTTLNASIRQLPRAGVAT